MLPPLLDHRQGETNNAYESHNVLFIIYCTSYYKFFTILENRYGFFLLL
jgi:hypothetical protein